MDGLDEMAVAALVKMRQSPRRVVVESPFAGKTEGETQTNVAYARACIRDCLLRGEAPFASHLLYTQDGVLDDGSKAQRDLGIEAGLAFVRFAEATVVYLDRGLSKGMALGVERARAESRPVEERRLPGWENGVRAVETPQTSKGVPKRTI